MGLSRGKADFCSTSKTIIPMKRLTFNLTQFAPFALAAMLVAGCGGSTEPETAAAPVAQTAAKEGGQSTVEDNDSQKNVVAVAVGSKDHTTLVAAVKAAELVDALSNAGPFTVFAPTNEAFAALPAGTVDGLLKPEKKNDLIDILQYHVAVGVYKPESFRDGQVLGMVNGGNVTLHVKDGQVMVNDAKIIGTVPASNGLVCVIDKVLLPR